MFEQLTMADCEVITGGGLEEVGYALGATLGTAGTVVCIAAAPFTGGQSLWGAASCAGTAAYSWGCLTD